MTASDVRLKLASLGMTVSFCAAVPFSVRLIGTWRQRFFALTDGSEVSNYMLPMGLASMALICCGVIVTWTGFRRGLKSAWFLLFLIAWIFYFPVLVLPYVPADWKAVFEAVLSSSMAREVSLQLVGFLFMLGALALPLKEVFSKRIWDSGSTRM